MSQKDRYIINSNKILGAGATARVYLGINSANGSQYAIKCSKNNIQTAGKMLEDEYKMVKDLDNKYIVKFYECIPNFQKFERVIIMEYCNQGSVYTFTELHQGLCDNMFLKVLECLYSGIRYLRQQNIMHRDIKPGNMMVHQDNMGYYHVKIVDLGAAKVLEEDQQFKTICGTPEYLHPDMFIRYLGGIARSFKPSYDLWSTGVTLYHAAITKLPFQPFKETKSPIRCKEALKKMYETKTSNYISAIQNSKNPNDITWYEKLPDKCRMSPMLRDLAATLIRHLLDLDDIISYDQFYKEAQELCDKNKVLVFNSLSGELLIIYLDSLTYDNIAHQISLSIGRPIDDLILLTKNKVLERLANPTAECLRPLPLRGHLKYTLTEDTVLVVVRHMPSEMPSLVSKHMSNKKFSLPEDKYSSLDKVSRYSEYLMRAIYQIGYNSNYIDCQRDCYLATMFAFNQYIYVDDLRLMNAKLQWQMLALEGSCSKTKSFIDVIEDSIGDKGSHEDITEIVDQCKVDMSKLLQNRALCLEKIGESYTSIVEQRSHFDYTNEQFYRSKDDDANDNLDFLIHLSEEVVNELNVLQDKRYSDDESLYKLEVWERHVRLYHFYEAATTRYNSKVSSLSEVHKFFFELLTKALKGIALIGTWKSKVDTMEQKRLTLDSDFDQIVSLYKVIVTAQDDGKLKSRILEIKQLTDQLKNYYEQ